VVVGEYITLFIKDKAGAEALPFKLPFGLVEEFFELVTKKVLEGARERNHGLLFNNPGSRNVNNGRRKLLCKLNKGLWTGGGGRGLNAALLPEDFGNRGLGNV
jgi:hypothetical protein